MVGVDPIEYRGDVRILGMVTGVRDAPATARGYLISGVVDRAADVRGVTTPCTPRDVNTGSRGAKREGPPNGRALANCMWSGSGDGSLPGFLPFPPEFRRFGHERGVPGHPSQLATSFR